MSPRPGFQDQLPTTGRHPPLSGWRDLNPRPLGPEPSAPQPVDRRDDRIRTCGPLAPSQVRYQPAPGPGVDRGRMVRSGPDAFGDPSLQHLIISQQT